MDEIEVKRWAEKLYNERISDNLNAVDAAGQWGEKELVPLICEEILKKIEIKKNDRVLEVGCGSGVLGSYLKDKCSDYYGIDISFKMLQKFQIEYNQERRFNLIQGVTDNLPFLDNSFSKILINSVTMYLHGKKLLENTLLELERVSKKNSIIFIGDNITPDSIYWEYSWFQNKNSLDQFFAKQYIKSRLWLARSNPKLAGKWKFHYKSVHYEFIRKFFGMRAKTYLSESAARTIKKRVYGEKLKGNRRVDFIIRFD